MQLSRSASSASAWVPVCDQRSTPTRRGALLLLGTWTLPRLGMLSAGTLIGEVARGEIGDDSSGTVSRGGADSLRLDALPDRTFDRVPKGFPAGAESRAASPAVVGDLSTLASVMTARLGGDGFLSFSWSRLVSSSYAVRTLGFAKRIAPAGRATKIRAGSGPGTRPIAARRAWIRARASSEAEGSSYRASKAG